MTCLETVTAVLNVSSWPQCLIIERLNESENRHQSPLKAANVCQKNLMELRILMLDTFESWRIKIDESVNYRFQLEWWEINLRIEDGQREWGVSHHSQSAWEQNSNWSVLFLERLSRRSHFRECSECVERTQSSCDSQER